MKIFRVTLKTALIAALAVASLLGAAPSVRAADPGNLASADAAVRSRLHLAEEYVREDRHEDALEIYRQILETRPGFPKAERGLKSCLLELKRYDELTAILENELASAPENPGVLEQLGTVAARKGDREAAARWWRRILEVQKHSVSAYSFVADLLARNRLLDESLEVYAAAEERYPGRFTRQRASLHEQRFEFDAATDAYLTYLDQSPTALSYVEGRLLRIGEAEEGLDKVIARVSRWMEVRRREAEERAAAEGNAELGGAPSAVGAVTSVTYRKLLGDLHLEAGDHESARLHYFALVEEVPGQHNSLLVFGKRCQTDGEHEVAIRVFEWMVAELPGGRTVPSALTEIARSQRELGRWEDALATYERIGRDYPETDFDYAARFEAGRLQRDGLRDPAAAEAIFRELLPLPRGPWGEADPQFEVAECALWQGEMERASGIFRAIRMRDFGEGTKERSLYEEARAVYYTGDFALADSLFKEVAQRHPKGDHVNDALEFSILINQNRDEEEVLMEYAGARWSLRTGDAGAAIEALKSLTTKNPGVAIEDEAFLLLGMAHRQDGNPAAAMDALLRAAARAQVPDLAADARLLRAEILADELGDVPAALAEYESLLLEYPETLAADRARDRSAELTRMLP